MIQLRVLFGFDGEIHGDYVPTHARDWQRGVQAACGRAVQIREARAEDEAHPSGAALQKRTRGLPVPSRPCGLSEEPRHVTFPLEQIRGDRCGG